MFWPILTIYGSLTLEFFDYKLVIIKKSLYLEKNIYKSNKISYNQVFRYTLQWYDQ